VAKKTKKGGKATVPTPLKRIKLGASGMPLSMDIEGCVLMEMLLDNIKPHDCGVCGMTALECACSSLPSRSPKGGISKPPSGRRLARILREIEEDS